MRGTVSYFRGFVKNFDDAAEPITKLLRINEFCVGRAQNQTFEKLKNKIVSANLLAFPNFTKKREALAVIFVLHNLRHIKYGYDITVYTDHKPLEFLLRETVPDGQLKDGLYQPKNTSYELNTFLANIV